MDGRRLKYASKQMVPKALDLHIFIAGQSQIEQHIQSNQKLRHLPGVPMLSDEQEDAQSDGKTNIAEIEQIKQVVHRQPKRDCHCFKDCQHNHGQHVFLHLTPP